MGKFSPETLPELLAVYYKRLFPFDAYTRWLSYGKVNPTFSHRELSFTLAGDIYIRYQSFDKPADFEIELQKKCPEKIDIGAVYNIKPRSKKLGSDFKVLERELIFDIDITDYDSVRTCCKEADVCSKCWKLMSIATKILDTALRDDFGFKHILWVFSGRRGIHCWVCDEVARKLESNVRSAVAEYLQILIREDSAGKMVNLSDNTHPSIKRALEIIDKVFVEVCVEGQNILGTTQGMSQMLQLMEDNLRKEVEPAWERLHTSVDRWNAFVGIFERMRGELKWKNKHLVDEIMLQWAYPRLDIAVTKGANHLLKSPFCIHPKTGKLCIPFNPATAFTFDPDGVPSINELIEELQEFDRKEAQEEDDLKRKVKNYKKTSMYKSMQIFEEFLRNLEVSRKNSKAGEWNT
uniref:DNA primase n=1 Tax=Lygus hesperus TaxID=30085 RepID=A0A0A9X7K8_LYGHE